MDKATRVLIVKKLERAQDDLRFAHSLQAQGGYRQAISRAYYAIFAAASAALLTQGISRKRHSGVESAFNQHLAHAGLVKRELAVIYRNAFDARQDADYSDHVEFGATMATQVLAEAEEFVQGIEQFLKAQGV